MIQAERQIGEKVEREDRYYILSRPLKAAEFTGAIRTHWGIENQALWVLDVAFHEDRSRIRARHVAENFAVLRHITLNALRRHPARTWGSSIRTGRLVAG